MSDVNVVRGCGSRKKGGYYLEAETNPNGTLNLITYCFGSHIDAPPASPAENLIAEIPSRGLWLGDLAASFLTGEWIFEKNPYSPPLRHTAVYEEFQQRFHCPIALGDKVSKEYYSCASFINEVREHGPSRKIPEHIAKKIARHLPLPIIFFFDLPLFSSKQQRDAALQVANIDLAGYDTDALWNLPEYGISVEYPNDGVLHFMSNLIYRLEEDVIRGFIREEGIQTAVMPGCICWLNQVRYMLDDGEDSSITQEKLSPFGIEVVDLDVYQDDHD